MLCVETKTEQLSNLLSNFPPRAVSSTKSKISHPGTSFLDQSGCLKSLRNDLGFRTLHLNFKKKHVKSAI